MVTDEMVCRALNAEFCGRIVRDCLAHGTDYDHEVMRAALIAALAVSERDAVRYRWFFETTHIPEEVNLAVFLGDKESADAAIDTLLGADGLSKTDAPLTVVAGSQGIGSGQ